MDLIQHLPETLVGPRTYFSLIDRNNLKFAQDWNKYKEELDQILKVLLLTKDTIVVAGSSLCTERAMEYFSEKEKNKLFENGIIRPAIRSQFQNFSEVFNDRVVNKKETLSTEINSFFSSLITEIVPWDLNDNANWLGNQVERQVVDELSPLRASLREISSKDEKLFVDILQPIINTSKSANSYYDRDRVTLEIQKNFKDKSLSAINQFLDLLYYISGSRVVNCENYVPQENLIYFNHATMNFGQKVLSDKEVFYNIVANTILSNIYNNTFPIDVIGNLDFKDIIALRENNKAKSKVFREKYEQCLSIAQSSHNIDDKHEFLYNLEQLSALSDDIRKQFDTSIQNELTAFKSKLKLTKNMDYVFEIASQMIGLFSLPVSIISLIFNDTKLKETNLLKQARTKSSNTKENLIRNYLKKKYQNDPILTSFFNDIINKHKENYLKIDL